MSTEPVTVMLAVEITVPDGDTAAAALHTAARELSRALPDDATQVNAMAFRGLTIQDIQEAHQAKEDR